jgi:hypothetical protein
VFRISYFSTPKDLKFAVLMVTWRSLRVSRLYPDPRLNVGVLPGPCRQPARPPDRTCSPPAPSARPRSPSRAGSAP